MRLSVKLALTVGMFLVYAPAWAAFTDVPSNHSYRDAINYVQSKGIVEGYSNGTYQPEQKINRAEFVKILMYYKFGESMVEMCGSTTHFRDVAYDAWYNKSFCRARDAHVIEGYSDGTARPENFINFVEAAKIIALTDTFGVGYPDLPPQKSGAWYRQFVDYLGEHHAIPMSITNFDALISRGEMAEMIYRLDAEIDYLPSQTYETLAGLPQNNEAVNEVSLRFTVNSTLNPYTLILNLNSGEASIVDGDNKTVLSFDAFYISKALSDSRGRLRNGTSNLREFFTVTDINDDEFNDIRLLLSQNQYEEYVFDPQQLKFFWYEHNQTQPEVQSNMGIEYCTGSANSIDDLPVHPSYSHFGKMGKLFTASDCGTQRYRAVVGLFPRVERMEITLSNYPSWNLYNALYAAGLACSDGTTNESIKCRKWQRYEAGTPDSFLGLKEFADEITTMVTVFPQ